MLRSLYFFQQSSCQVEQGCPYVTAYLNKFTYVWATLMCSVQTQLPKMLVINWQKHIQGSLHILLHQLKLLDTVLQSVGHLNENLEDVKLNSWTNFTEVNSST